jgi:hypothetical protein
MPAAVALAGERLDPIAVRDGTGGIFKTRIPVAGDVTFDGIVNIEDFNSLYSNFGKNYASPDRSTGDFNLDGVVNFADFQMLERNFGRAPPGVESSVTPANHAELAHFAATVPEPGTMSILALATACGLARRRARRRC